MFSQVYAKHLDLDEVADLGFYTFFFIYVFTNLPEIIHGSSSKKSVLFTGMTYGV